MPPLILSITTRGIGVNLCSFYNDVVGLLPTTGMGKPKVELPNIYATYRALLALVESRFLNLNRIVYSEHAYVHSPKLKDYYNIMNIPIIFTRLLEAINILHYNDIIYVPAMVKNTIIEGKFIPRPENIILSNLRQTVEALTEADADDDDHCTLMNRKNFYKNNPIPGAIWNDNYGLMNANEIIPRNYDLRKDVHDDMHALVCLSMQLSKYSNYINKDCANRKVTQSSFSSLICNEMGDLRVPDRDSEELLYNYYRHSRPQNNIDSFYSRFKLRNEQVIKEGSLFLLGEYPNDESIAKPVYELRSEHVNSYYYCEYSYKTSYLSYHNDVLAKSLRNA